MKAILKFTLPDDQQEFDNSLKGTDFLIAAMEFREYLRRTLKYQEDLSEDKRRAYEHAQAQFLEYFKDLLE